VDLYLWRVMDRTLHGQDTEPGSDPADRLDRSQNFGTLNGRQEPKVKTSGPPKLVLNLPPLLTIVRVYLTESSVDRLRVSLTNYPPR